MGRAAALATKTIAPNGAFNGARKKKILRLGKKKKTL